MPAKNALAFDFLYRQATPILKEIPIFSFGDNFQDIVPFALPKAPTC